MVPCEGRTSNQKKQT